MAITDMDRAITHRVIRAREAAGLQKQEVARKLGLSAPGYSHYENYNNPFTLAQLGQLSRILNRSLEYFLGLDSALTEREDRALALYREAEDKGLGDLALTVLAAVAGTPVVGTPQR